MSAKQGHRGTRLDGEQNYMSTYDLIMPISNRHTMRTVTFVGLFDMCGPVTNQYRDTIHLKIRQKWKFKLKISGLT